MAAHTRDRDAMLNQAIGLLNTIIDSPGNSGVNIQAGVNNLARSNNSTPTPSADSVQDEVNALFRRSTGATTSATPALSANMRYETRRSFGNWATTSKKKRLYFPLLLNMW